MAALHHSLVGLCLFLCFVRLSWQGCAPAPVVTWSQSYNIYYTADEALVSSCGFDSYWVAPGGAVAPGFALDYGETVQADGFHLRNENNVNSMDRSTKDFRIEVSNDNVNWTTVVEDRMPGGIPDSNCENTLLVTPAGKEVISFRYVRFTAVTHHANSAGLSFFAPRDINCDRPGAIMDFSFFPEHPWFRADNTQSELCSEYTESYDGNDHWVGYQGHDDRARAIKGVGFLLDMRQSGDIMGFRLKNDNNYPSRDAGTEFFEILLSEDLRTWTQVVEGYLPENTAGVCPDASLFLNRGHQVLTARYVRFRDLSNYIIQPALAFLEPIYYTSDGSVRTSLPECSGVPAVIEQTSWEGLEAWNAVSPGCGYNSYWVGPEETDGAYFVLDYGHRFEADGFHLRNGKNGLWRDRSVRDFRIEVSTDLTNWVLSAQGTLPNNRQNPAMFCDETKFIPLESGEEILTIRYVKFTADTYHGRGASLSFIAARQTGCTEPQVVMDFSHHPELDHAYGASAALEGETCSAKPGVLSHNTFWKGHQNYFNATNIGGVGFILDLGGVKDVVAFALKNDHNVPHYDQ